MLFGVAFYSLIVGLISSFVTDDQNLKQRVQLKLNELEEMGKEMKLPPSILAEIQEATIYSSNEIPYL